jgi:Trp operon repressor
MAATAIKIINKNIQYLKSSLGITEAHITWGTKSIKKKYSKIKERLQLKLKEQYIDKRYYQSLIS